MLIAYTNPFSELAISQGQAQESEEFRQKISASRAFPMAINAIYYALSSLNSREL